MKVEEIRKDFPIFQQQVNGHPLVYLDNAATTQRPRQVVEAVMRFYQDANANVHRSVHTMSYRATELYEGARKKIASFINASSWREIVWVRGATEGLNLLAYSLGLYHLREGDEIVLTVMEHHSNMVPWQRIAQLKNLRIVYAGVTPEGRLDIEDLKAKISSRTRLISVIHASNVLGVVNPVGEIAQLARDAGAIFIVDAAQSAPHMPIDVEAMGCDFLVASGHKMLGPTGIGFLYGRRERLEAMEPFQSGGDMIEHVTLEGATWNELPWKFEAGTPNIAGAIGLGAAVDYINNVGLTDMLEHEKELRRYAVERIRELGGVDIYTPDGDDVLGIVSFNIHGIHPHDVAGYLDQCGIEVRSGHHCTQPLMECLRIENAVRASFYLYNTKEEVDRLVEALARVKKLFRV